MANFDPNNAQCAVFTFKEGLLSTVAHDLKLKAQRFSGTIATQGDGFALSFEADAASLVVEAVMKDGKEDAYGLSDKDKAKIAKTIQSEVLESHRYPSIRFSGQGKALNDTTLALSGTFVLHGQSRPLSLHANLVGEFWEVLFPIHQPDFGIKPFSAMLGALKIQPGVKVRVRLPASTLAGELRHG